MRQIRLHRHTHVIEHLEFRRLLSTYFVDANAPGLTQNGSSWEFAFKDLQTILTSPTLVSGDTVKVADGTYKPTTTTDRTISFNLKNGVGLFGGYAGYGAADPEVRDTSLYPTILSGDIGSVGTNTDNSSRVVTANSVGSTTVLDGVTITLGNADGVGYPNTGGGMYNYNSSPTLANCTFAGNAANNNGGGMYNDSSSPSLTDCAFTQNTAYSVGGGVFNNSCSPTITSCAFSENTAIRGGGMYNYYSLPTLTTCAFSRNTTSYFGGGMENYYSSPMLTTCTFSGNTSNIGAGMYNYSSSPTLTHCTITGNTAPSSGGGVCNISSSPTLTNCTFIGNTAIDGGGMYNNSSSPSLSNCILAGNSVSNNGGGVFVYNDSSPTFNNCAFIGNMTFGTSSTGNGGGMYADSNTSPALVNCTFTANSSDMPGGGIYAKSASPKLTNCIIWGNSTGFVASGGSPIVTYSNIQGGFSGTGNINVNPQFVRSPWVGSDELFGTSDDDLGDLRLRIGSLSLNVGKNSAVTTSADLAGNPRIQDGNVDLGAYEGAVSVPDPKTYYVDSFTTGSNTGTSWANAFTSLQTALDIATEGDSIRVAQGVYKPTDTANRGLSFSLRANVSIYGGYAGWASPTPDARNTTTYPTILSGDIGIQGDQSDNSYHVVIAINIPTALLDGVSIKYGNADNTDTSQGYGGGIRNSASSPTYNNCVISNNNTVGSGGGVNIYCYSKPTINNCLILCNTSSNHGAGLSANNYSNPIINKCIFDGNSTTAKGGGFSFYQNTSSVLTNCLFVGNLAAYGSGLYISSNPTSTTLINCTFTKNIDTASSNLGVINSYNSLSTLTNCILWGNSGAFYNSGSTITATYCDIQGGYSGTGNNNSDPRFIRSRWTGPDGLWGTLDDDYTGFRLGSTSPCLNKGLNSANTTTTDLAGNARIQNTTIDMGVYEGAFSSTPTTFYVDINSVGNNSGSSWTNAFTTLQSAILSAKDGDTIKVADGTYKPTATTDRTLSFALRNAVSIMGGYAGYGAPDPNARNIALYPTILSGDIGIAGNKSDNSFHVVSASSVGSTTVLNGVIITLGNANGSGTNQNLGGGILIDSASPSILNCSFLANTASSSGGGIYLNSSSTPTMTNCTFVGNSATSSGGGLYTDLSSVMTLTNCSFTQNSSASGKAIYNAFSPLKLTNCILWNNGVTPIYNNSSSPTITYSDVEGGYSGTHNLNADPLFVRNPSTGPDGLWGTTDDDTGDLHLQFSSPCLNTGVNSANISSTDIASNPRIALSIIDMGAYETQPIPITIPGTDSDDSFVMKYSPDNAMLQIWNSPDTASAPVYSYSLSTIDISTFTLDLGSGNDTLLIDLSAISTLRLSLANIENVQFLTTRSDSMILYNSQINFNSLSIPCSGAPTFQLNSPFLSSIYLSDVALKLASNTLIATLGDAAALRQYLYNASIGAKPSIVCGSATTLALIDNSKLHKTSFAGTTLSEPYCQVLIQPATPGDANLDGVVNEKDLLSIYANLNKSETTWLNGDVDQSGTVDLADLAIVQSKLSSPLAAALKVQKKSPKAMVVRSKPVLKHKVQKTVALIGVNWKELAFRVGRPAERRAGWPGIVHPPVWETWPR